MFPRRQEFILNVHEFFGGVGRRWRAMAIPHGHAFPGRGIFANWNIRENDDRCRVGLPPPCSRRRRTMALSNSSILLLLHVSVHMMIHIIIIIVVVVVEVKYKEEYCVYIASRE